MTNKAYLKIRWLCSIQHPTMVAYYLQTYIKALKKTASNDQIKLEGNYHANESNSINKKQLQRVDSKGQNNDF